MQWHEWGKSAEVSTAQIFISEFPDQTLSILRGCNYFLAGAVVVFMMYEASLALKKDPFN